MVLNMRHCNESKTFQNHQSPPPKSSTKVLHQSQFLFSQYNQIFLMPKTYSQSLLVLEVFATNNKFILRILLLVKNIYPNNNLKWYLAISTHNSKHHNMDAFLGPTNCWRSIGIRCSSAHILSVLYRMKEDWAFIDEKDTSSINTAEWDRSNHHASFTRKTQFNYLCFFL